MHNLKKYPQPFIDTKGRFMSSCKQLSCHYEHAFTFYNPQYIGLYNILQCKTGVVFDVCAYVFRFLFNVFPIVKEYPLNQKVMINIETVWHLLQSQKRYIFSINTRMVSIKGNTFSYILLFNSSLYYVCVYFIIFHFNGILLTILI